MAASLAFCQLQFHLSTFSHCKLSSTFQFRHPLPSLCVSNSAKQAGGAQLPRQTAEELSTTGVRKAPNADSNSGLTNNTRRDGKKILERRNAYKEKNKRIGVRRRVAGSGDSSTAVKGRNSVRRIKKGGTFDDKNGVNVSGKEKRAKKPKIDSPETTLRIGLDTCSKRGDVLGAIKLYELANRDGITLGQYHYAVLLYLCSSAATGTVQPAKSGSGGRSLNSNDPVEANSVIGSESVDELGEMGKWMVGVSNRVDVNDVSNFINGSIENVDQTLEGLVQELRSGDYEKCEGIQMSNDVKRVALQKGFEIYNDMRTKKVPVNEATLTSVARMAMAFGDGDTAFDMVNQMIEHGISPKLRSYGPALAIFVSNGDVEKAFMVEEHMLAHGVHPEEPELEALLRVSVEAGKSDKVYYVLHRLRTNVRQVSEGTADLIERWFKSKVASRVGKRRWDKQMIAQAMENVGGGWHGNGWLGQGKWIVHRSSVDSDGSCKSCGVKLATIDLDPLETENFAKSVASFALQREKHSSFQKFQKWLDYFGPFEAVVDAANVGLYSQRNFKPSKVNAVVNGIRQMLPSRKWPLIILHHRRIKGEKMDEPFNKSLIEKWRNGDALYATPSGSNDDWYWLYAAIKCKCLIVTNDEMRDHLFQLLGNDFFPKWKERHQVHFTFTETGPVFHMPPACSIVIQESEKGHWHIPIASEVENEDKRTWLCCTRANSSLLGQDSLDEPKVSGQGQVAQSEPELQELGQNSKPLVLTSAVRNHGSIIPELMSAEEIGGCVIDFQI